MGLDINSFLISFEPGSFGEKVEFDYNEKEKLIAHFKNNEINQFYLIIIQKVLENKSFTLDKHEIITQLLPIISKVNFKEFSINSDEDIIRFAEMIYLFLFEIDIEEFGKTEF